MIVKKRVRCPCCASLIEIEITDVTIGMEKKVVVDHSKERK